MLRALLIFSWLCCSSVDARALSDVLGVDVLESLKNEGISCDLHGFVTSSDNHGEKEYQTLRHDLDSYCSKSESTHLAAVLCRMILIELQIGCALANDTRPKPIVYSATYTPAQICSTNKIVHTNKWAWEKLTVRERARIGSSWVNLCAELTKANSTLRLVRFFYKMASAIRHAEASHAAQSGRSESAGRNPGRRLDVRVMIYP